MTLALPSADELRVRAEGLRRFGQLPDEQQARVRARMAVLAEMRRFVASSEFSRRTAIELFAAEYSAGRIELGAGLRGLVERVDAATLYRWEKREREQGLGALADGYGNRAGTGLLDTDRELQNLVLGVVAEHKQFARPKRIWEYLKEKAPEKAARTSDRTVRRWLATWKREHPREWLQLVNPDAARSKHGISYGSLSEDVHRLNQLWELDSTPADLLLVDGRYSIVAVIDVFSRRTKLLVTPTSRAVAIAALCRRALLEWGVPESAKTDRGRDYTSHHLEAVFRALDVEHRLCVPYQPQQKPHVERVIKTFLHDLVELLPGFCGHSVSDRQALESQQSFARRMMTRDEKVQAKWTSSELQRFIDEWETVRYPHRIHEGLQGRTPWQVASDWQEPVRRIPEAEIAALDVLLQPVGVRTIGKRGIQHERASYIAPELVAREPGERVLVRIDPTDDAGKLYVFDEQNRPICVAVCPELLGESRAERAAKARAVEAQVKREARERMAEARKALGGDDVAQTILAGDRRRAEKLAALPRPAENHETPALKAAAQLTSAPAPAAPADPEELARGSARVTSLTARLKTRNAEEEEDLRLGDELFAEWSELRELPSPTPEQRSRLRELERDPLVKTRRAAQERSPRILSAVR